jgi:hypothetical protein
MHGKDTLIEDIIAWRPFDSPSASGSGTAPPRMAAKQLPDHSAIP